MQKPDLLAPYNSITKVNIAWGDMDAAQHVNNIMYLRYFETARIQYMEEIDFGFKQENISIILAEVNVKYRIPLTFPDKVWIGTKAILDSIDETSLWTEQIIVSEKYKNIATICKAKLVCYDYISLNKTQWPANVLDIITLFENK